MEATYVPTKDTGKKTLAIQTEQFNLTHVNNLLLYIISRLQHYNRP